MNIFQQYGIKEVADVCLYAIELDENDDEIYVPVLYLDTLKVSTVEETAEQTSAQGGLGNSKLITWDYGKEITVTLEDALFSPASQGMAWGGSLGAKTLKLYLRNFVDRGDREIDPNKEPTGAVMTVERFSDFLIIPDRWPSYELKNHCSDKHTTGYVGGTSIYCWLVDANIITNNGKKRVSVEDLLLFYREQTQKWYFFNGRGPVGEEFIDSMTAGMEDGEEKTNLINSIQATWYKIQNADNGIEKYAIGYQYGRDTFNWIKDNLNANNIDKWMRFVNKGVDTAGPIYKDGANQHVNNEPDVGVSEAFGNERYAKNNGDIESKHRWTEYEAVAQETIQNWTDSPPCEKYGRGPDYNVMAGEVNFLTQTLYIDGYRTDKCARNRKYSELTQQELELEGYEPTRYLTSIDVEYNTNIVPPQEAIYQVDHALENVFYLDRIEKCRATDRFCIDTDVNLKHGQYRYMEKYAQTELTVFIDPKTMQPYEPNTFEYYRKNGQRITGNLRAFKQYEIYYKWTRTKAVDRSTLGKQIVVDATHFPGTYRLVGETYARSRKTGKDQRYQFEIPLCKMGTENNLTLQADGDPTTFTMTLTALRRADGVMMKLTQYDVVDKKYGKYTSGSTEIVPYDDIYEPTDEDLDDINETFEEEIISEQEKRSLIGISIATPDMNAESGDDRRSPFAYYDLDSPRSVDKLTMADGDPNTQGGIYNETEAGQIHVQATYATVTTTSTKWKDKETGEIIKYGDITTSKSDEDSRWLDATEYTATLNEQSN